MQFRVRKVATGEYLSKIGISSVSDQDCWWSNTDPMTFDTQYTTLACIFHAYEIAASWCDCELIGREYF